MKIEMRVAVPWTNDGSSTSAIITIRPSAGAITSLSPRSPVRSGSRKNQATHSAMIVSRNASSQSGHDRRMSASPNVPTASAAAIRMNGMPSRATFIRLLRARAAHP